MSTVAPAARRRTVIRPAGRFSLDVRELWEYRELLQFLVWRDVKVRYKQTVIGAAWAVLQPLVTMLVFSLVFGRFAGIPSEGVPYPIFVFAGLLVWLYVSQAVNGSATSLVAGSALVTKVYFPRILVPLGAALVPAVDFAVAVVVLGALMAWYGIHPGVEALAVPAFLLLAAVTAVGVGLLASALNVRFRDVPYAMPFIVQLWLFASPVVYPLEILSGTWERVFALNPMAAVVEGMRWALLGTPAPDAWTLVAGTAAAVTVAVAGVAYFARVEQHFADVI